MHKENNYSLQIQIVTYHAGQIRVFEIVKIELKISYKK